MLPGFTLYLRVPRKRNQEMHDLSTITIRTAGPADERMLDRLAALDSALRPSGWMLLAEVEGEPWAAVDVGSGAVIADPFRPTADLVALLRLRATRLRRAADVGTSRRRRSLTFKRERSRHALATER